MGYLLDTNVAIHFRDRDRQVMQELATIDGPLILSVLSLIELESGLYSKPGLARSRQRGLAAILPLFTIIGVTRDIVPAYGRIIAERGFSRRRVLDRLIAATAIIHDHVLVTVNGDDFADIPGLALEVWPAQ